MEGEEEEEAGVCAFVGTKEEEATEEEEEAEDLLHTNKQPLYNLSSSSTKELQLQIQSVVRLQEMRLHVAISNILPFSNPAIPISGRLCPKTTGGRGEGRAITKTRSLPLEVELWANSSESWVTPLPGRLHNCLVMRCPSEGLKWSLKNW